MCEPGGTRLQSDAVRWKRDGDNRTGELPRVSPSPPPPTQSYMRSARVRYSVGPDRCSQVSVGPHTRDSAMVLRVSFNFSASYEFYTPVQ